MLDWQTEEDQTWDEQPQPQTAVSPWPRRFLWLLLVLLLGGGGWYTAGFLQERVETTTQETEADLRQAHALLRQAALRQDAELFNLLLSGRDEGWARAQERLVRNGQLLDRFSWGLSHRPELVTADPVTDILLSPDLLTAEVTAVETYQFWSIADQQVKTTRLQQSAVYRLGPDRWLYAPPDADFWGNTVEMFGENWHLTYLERDRGVVEQLFPNLNALLANTCRLPGLDVCPPIRVEFTTDPGLLSLSINDAILNPAEPVLLPTPTLLGIPQDAAGHEFLWLAYGRYLSSALITGQTGYDCCANALIYQSLLHYQLAQLNLLDWPFPEAAVAERYVDLMSLEESFNHNFILDDLYNSFTDLSLLADAVEAEENLATIAYRQLSSARQTAYLLIDYLAAGQNRTPVTLQRQLRHHDQLPDWYYAVNSMPAESETHLRLQLADHNTRYRTDVPPLVDGLTITCAPISGNLRLTYDPLSRTWQEHVVPPLPAILTKDGWPAPTPLQVHATPYTDVYLLQTRDVLYLATADWLRPVAFENGMPINDGILQLAAVPNGRLLSLTWERLLFNQRITQHYQIDIDVCDETHCPAQSIPGQVFWSPDGRNSLIAVNDEQGETIGLYTGDERASLQTYIDTHFDRLPLTWLGDEHFAYPTITTDETVAYTIQSLAGQQPLTIGASDLTHLLPDERDATRLVQPIQLVPSPANPQHILLLAARPWVRSQVGTGVAYEHHYLFWLELTADLSQIEQITLIQEMGAPVTIKINPPGDRAVVSHAGFILFTLNLPYELQESTFTPLPILPITDIPPLWSPGGEWLVLAYRFGLVFTNPPAFDLVHLAPYDLSNCFHSQWMP